MIVQILFNQGDGTKLVKFPIVGRCDVKIIEVTTRIGTNFHNIYAITSKTLDLSNTKFTSFNPVNLDISTNALLYPNKTHFTGDGNTKFAFDVLPFDGSVVFKNVFINGEIDFTIMGTGIGPDNTVNNGFGDSPPRATIFLLITLDIIPLENNILIQNI